jgi:2-phosphoglycerate kinase|tara:strand:- start:3738 stop:4925 length:1188 start_codon:yes stop_codon:yes gene_type:complete
MGKVLITEATGTQAVPFLRGILTRSLQIAGLSFEEAYGVASDIRQELSKGDEDLAISSQILQEIVEKQLRETYGSELADRYISWVVPPTTVFVRANSDTVKPFSRGQFQHGLNPCCLSPEESTNITSMVYEHLLNMGVREITSSALIEITEQYLQQEVSDLAAQRYTTWTRFLRSNRPLVLLIGGVSGCGKSTIATELAHRLDIVRTQSTDMLREVMRMMVPKRLVPVLHTSSFVAWQMLPSSEESETTETEPDELLAQGYRSQVELVSVACEGAIQRALQERVSLILEGVHVHPSLLQKISKRKDAVIVLIMLGVLKQSELRSRIKGRREEAPDRRSKRYLAHFDSICRLQSFLLSEADKAHATIIPNDDKETAVQEIMRTIMDKLADSQIETQ